MNEPVSVAVLAKAPIAGFAKTRLIPVLGARGAAVLQERLVERAVETACAAAIGPVTLWATPDESHPVFQSIGARLGITLARQVDGDRPRRIVGTGRRARRGRVATPRARRARNDADHDADDRGYPSHRADGARQLFGIQSAAARASAASVRPTIGANLNPCPEQAEPTTTRPCRSSTKRSSAVFV